MSESTITIDAPVRAVFDLLLDLENARYFDPQVVSVRRTTPGSIGVGSRFEFHEPSPPFGRVGCSTATYVDVVPTDRIAMQLQLGGLRARCSFALRAEGSGTHLTVRAEVLLSMPLRLLSPLMDRRGKQQWDTRLAWIRDWIEVGAPRRVARPPLEARRNG